MKLIGIAGGAFKVVDDVDPSKLIDLKGSLDFLWLDMDSANQPNTKLARDLFGIKDLQESGFPRVVFEQGYDMLILDYYERLVRKELLIYYSDFFILTVHTGPCKVCDEAVAALNELMVSGKLSSGGILFELITGVQSSINDEILLAEDTVRNLTYQIKEGGGDLNKVVALYNGVKHLNMVVSHTKDLILVVEQESSFIKDKTPFKTLYSLAVGQYERTVELFDGLDDLYKDAIPSTLSHMLAQRKALGSLSIIALTLASAAIALIFLPGGLFGLSAMTMAMVIIGLGILLSFVYQRIGTGLRVK